MRPPPHEAVHQVGGVELRAGDQAVGQRQRHAGVVRPLSRPETERAAADHLRLPGIAIARHELDGRAEGVAHGETEEGAPGAVNDARVRRRRSDARRNDRLVTARRADRGHGADLVQQRMQGAVVVRAGPAGQVAAPGLRQRVLTVQCADRGPDDGRDGVVVARVVDGAANGLGGVRPVPGQDEQRTGDGLQQIGAGKPPVAGGLRSRAGGERRRDLPGHEAPERPGVTVCGRRAAPFVDRLALQRRGQIDIAGHPPVRRRWCRHGEQFRQHQGERDGAGDGGVVVVRRRGEERGVGGEAASVGAQMVLAAARIRARPARLR